MGLSYANAVCAYYMEDAMVADFVKNNIKQQYKEFKQQLASEKGEFCIRCSRPEENDSPINRAIHKAFAMLVLVAIGSFLYYLVSLG